MHARQELVRTLVPEIFQSERSAARHTRVEARRLGSVPPADALHAVAVHADEALRALTGMSRPLDLHGRLAGQVVGTTFSLLRVGVGDRLLDPERSYRGTLLGIHHGIETVILLRAAAEGMPEYDALVGYLGGWLETRRRLCDDCVAQLGWFAQNPEVARGPDSALGLWGLRRRIDAAWVSALRRGLATVG
ncbi:MAG: hypothetical protein ACK4YP_07960 [Myxococcota bacterium]